MPFKANDLTNRRFGRLIALRFNGKNADRKYVWTCICDCGKTKDVSSTHLTKGAIRSCGCLLSEVTSERNFKHGLWRTIEFRIWQGIKRRCYRVKEENYNNYGGRGIKVCERWKDSFSNFIEDMGPRPSALHSIERNDNDEDYSPDNCRWATIIEQANNRRNNVVIEFDGQRMTVTEWGRLLNVKTCTLRAWIKFGHSFESAIERYGWRKNDKTG